MVRKNTQDLTQRIAAGQCIVDGCDCPIDTRGLCTRHKNEFYSDCRSFESDDERLRFEKKMIQSGLVLARGEQRRLKRIKSRTFLKAFAS